MIQGRNILIYEGDVVIAAAKSCTINNNAEALENSSPASGTARSYTVGRTGWDISISTLVLGMKDHLLKVGQAYRLVWKVRGNDSDTMQGTAICTNAQVAATVGNLAQGSFQFLGSDDNGTIVTPPTPAPSDYVTEQDVVNIINQYDFTTEQWVQNYAGIANGVITIGTNSISPVTSVAMTVPAGFSVTGSPITKTGTLALAYATGYEGFTTALKNKIEEIYSWFEVDAAGDIKTKDTAGGHVRGLYSESFVSALGKNSSSSGGGVDLTAVWASLTNTESPTYSETLKININHIPNIGWSKITSKPSTISGYGISDAKIANGTITLGSSSITPLTASSSLAWGKLTGTPTTLAGYGIGDAKIANGVITLGSSTITPVTSVAMTVPTGFSVTGSPISKTGTLALAYATGYEGFTTALKEKIEALYSWFEVDADGNIKTKDMPNGTHRGFYTESFVSALGSNSEGGGSGAGLEDVWDSLTNQQGTVITDSTKIAIAHIPDTASTYGYLKSSALNGYATQSWVNQQGFLTTHQTLYTLSIYGGTTKVLDFKPNANASIYIKAEGDISLTNDTTNKYITLSYTHPTNGANTTISAASGKVLSAITVNSLGHVTSVSSKTLASADIPDISATYATASRATTLEGYFNSGGVAKVAAKLNTGTTTYSAWGQTYWSSGVPQSISGNMTSVGSITPSANGNALGTSSARFNIYGTAGNFSGNVSITGTLGVTGATTLTGLLTANGGIVVPSTKTIKIGNCTISWDSTNSMLKFDTGIYSTGAVSALGSNSSGGGSGTFDEEAMWEALGTTSTAKVIASSHIPNLSASKITSGTLADARIPSLAASKITSGTFDTARIPNLDASKITSGTFAAARIPIATASTVGGIKVGSTLAISNGILNQKSGIATAGTYRSVTVDTYGRVTAGTNPTTLSGYGITNAYTKTQVDTALSDYLPLSGGTMTGTVWRKMTTDSSNYEVSVGWVNTSGSAIAEIGYLNTSQKIVINPTKATSPWVDAVGKYVLNVGNNLLTYNTYNILHANNYSDYALPLTGGTLYKSTTDAPLYVKTYNASGAYIGYQKNDGTTMGFIGVHPTYGAVYVSSGSTYPILRSDNYSSYALPLSGGTMTGNILFNTGGTTEKSVIFQTNRKTEDGGGWAYTPIAVRGADSSYIFHIGVYGSDNTLSYAYLNLGGSYSSANSLRIYDGTSPYPAWGTNKLLHEGNYSSYALPLTGGTLTGNVTFNAVNKGIYLTDSNGDTYAAIINNAENLWIGAQSISATHHTGGTYISAGSNRNLYVGKLVNNTRTSYIILDTDNTYVSSGKGYINGTEITTISGNAATASLLSYSHTNEINFKGGMQAFCFFNYRNADTGNQDGGTTAINYKFCNYTRETDYSTVTAGTFIGAFSGNATTATTLQTPRTIWGQSFDGSANVSGAMTGVAGVTLDAGARISKGGASGSLLYIGDTNNSGWVRLQDMCSQTGTAGDTYWSIRNGGNALFKEVTATSDERKKNIISNTKFNVKDIASARSVLFEWKDNTGLEKKVHGGSIAQDWLGKADWALTLGDDGYYSLNYGALALCSAITIAREVLKHDDEITRLKKEVAKQAKEIVDLKNKVREFEERRVA